MRLLRVLAAVSAGVALLAVPAAAQQYDYEGQMTGAEVVPGPGDPDGTGAFTVSIDNGTSTLCYAITFGQVDEPNAAHIHVGDPGTAGQIMVDLNWPANGPKACIPIDESTAGHATGSPKSHYVDLHTPAFADGAIRGQLQR